MLPSGDPESIKPRSPMMREREPSADPSPTRSLRWLVAGVVGGLITAVATVGLVTAVVAADLPDDALRLLPPGINVVVTAESLDAADALGAKLIPEAEDGPWTQGAAGLEGLLVESFPGLLGSIAGDLPFGVAFRLPPPTMPELMSATVVVPLANAVLEPRRLERLVADTGARIEGRYAAVSTRPDTAAAAGGNLLATSMPAGTVSVRADLATLADLARPLVEIGLMSLAQPRGPAAGDSAAAEPRLGPDQLASLQNVVRGALQGLERLDLALQDHGERTRLTGTLTVAPGNLFYPGPQPDFGAALELTRYLPPDAMLVQASAVDTRELVGAFHGLYETAIAAAAAELPEEHAEAYARWFADGVELADTWMVPMATAWSWNEEGARFYVVAQHPDAEEALQRTIDYYLRLDELDLGFALQEQPEVAMGGVRVRSFKVGIDPERLAELSEPSSSGPDPEMELALEMMARFYPPVWIATVADHVVVCGDPDPGAMGDLVLAVQDGRGTLRHDVEEAAERAGPGTQYLVLGNLGQIVRMLGQWEAMAGEPSGEITAIPQGEPIPCIVSSGVRGGHLDFACEVDMAAALKLLEELD
jgi:hypothetical protein